MDKCDNFSVQRARSQKITHPKTLVMIVAAIKALKDKEGSSLHAIKKYMADNYKVDTVKLAPFIKESLKSLVEKKALIQVDGNFKVAAAEKKEKKAAKPKAKNPRTP